MGGRELQAYETSICEKCDAQNLLLRTDASGNSLTHHFESSSTSRCHSPQHEILIVGPVIRDSEVSVRITDVSQVHLPGENICEF